MQIEFLRERARAQLGQKADSMPAAVVSATSLGRIPFGALVVYAYRCVGMGLDIGVSIEASERKEGQKGFVAEAFRWVVERTFAWHSRQRRLARNYEKKIKHQESMNYIVNARLCIGRFEKWLTI